MKKIFLITLLLFISTPFINAQEPDYTVPLNQLRSLTPVEKYRLRMLPVLKLPPGYRSRDLPYMVDNSTQIYMRPVFNQAGYSCGQASGVGYNFTYEMARARNIPANLAPNQYPTHFVWNFMNGGNGWYGVSYLHSFQILKHCGSPNVTDYGGTMSYGGPTRWMSGYQEYYNAMHNRITEVYQVLVDTETGLLTIKHWINDHLDGSAVGGIASFYAQYMSASNTLPAGTPEAGKYVLTYFGGSANHAMTIVGYNDSIRWDYNNDGQYTNDIDINNDGVVDMKDWEIGGFKMVQSYGGAPTWGDQGYAYMMYKTVADDLGQGGIWNHSAHLLYVKEICEPKLTAKIILEHDRRNAIKVLAGLANNNIAPRPEYLLDFPVFDYQGGNFYMQGGSTVADKTIEFGLDLSPLMTWLDMDQDVRLFLQIVEDDPAGQGTGEIIHFSVFDNTNGSLEIICPQTNVPVVNNDTTTLYLTHNFSFDKINIQTDNLPPAPAGQLYSYQMTAAGGSLPYWWEFDKSYGETTYAGSFPMVTAQQLTPSNNTSGIVTQGLDFDFPFYDSSFSSITVHVDGYLMFDEQLYPYPYFIDDKVLFTITRNISPFMTQYQKISTSSGGGIWYEGDENSATFRWKTSLQSVAGSEFNFAVTLYPSGEIKFHYGQMNGCDEVLWISGISNGDDVNFQQTGISNDVSVTSNSVFELNRYDYPPEMQLSDAGVFFGVPQANSSGSYITFKVTDNNFISSYKTLLFTTSGILVQDSISSGGDEIIEYGETALMSVLIINNETDTLNDATMTISIQDEYITLTDSTEYIGTLSTGGSIKLLDAFSFDVSSEVPNDHLIIINSEITSPDSTWENTFYHTAYAPDVLISEVIVNDDNGRLDRGDTTDIIVSFVNYGGALVENLYTLLLCDDTSININVNIGNIAQLNPGAQEPVVFNISVSDSAMNGHIVDFLVDMTGSNNYITADSFALVIGFHEEDFETGDFSLIDWGFGGDKDWQIDNVTRFEGLFSARSGFITDNQISSMIADMMVLTEGDISFYKRVSCEDDTTQNNYDFLAFYIDGIEQQRWDGQDDWSLHAYPVDQGFHRFEWKYHKDHSVSSRMDGAWIDFIAFPSVEEAAPLLTFNTVQFENIMRPDETGHDTLTLTNTGPGEIDFDIYVAALNQRSNTGSNRSVYGSYLTCPDQTVHTGKVYTWALTLYNSSPDNEWVRDLYIEFPLGVELTIATNFTGGTGDLLFEGFLGNGVTAHWHGEDQNGWGVVHGGETATAEITVYLHNTLMEDILINYEVHGDIYGELPHIINGNLLFRNFGPETEWLSLDTLNGTLSNGASNNIILTYDTEGLEDGDYYCELVVIDNFRNESVIPVILTVDQFLGMPQSKLLSENDVLSVYPNPFSDNVCLQVNLEQAGYLRLDIFNTNGERINNIFSGDIDKGRHVLYWNGTNEQGTQMAKGVYFLKITINDKIISRKLIMI